MDTNLEDDHGHWLEKKDPAKKNDLDDCWENVVFKAWCFDAKRIWNQ